MRTELAKNALLLASIVKKIVPTLTTRVTLQTINVVMVWQKTRCGGKRCVLGEPAQPGLPCERVEKARLTAARLWTSHCISTGPDVQNDVY